MTLMMTRTFQRRNMENFGTVRAGSFNYKGCLLRPERKYERLSDVRTPYGSRFTHQLQHCTERLEANTADHYSQTRNIRQLESELKARDRTITCLENRCEDRRQKNEILKHELNESYEEIDGLKYQLLETTTQFHEKEDAMSDTIRTLKIKLEYPEIRIKDVRPQETLDRIIPERRKIIEYCGNKWVHENDDRLYPEKKKITQLWRDKETELNEHITLLEAEKESRDKYVRELDRKIIGINQCKELVENKNVQLSEQINQLHKALANLQGNKPKADQTARLLEEKNQNLQAEVERLNEKVKTAEEMLCSRSISTNDRDGRQADSLTRQKDEQIFHLQDQLKQALENLDDKKAEMIRKNAEFSKTIEDLHKEKVSRDLKIKYIEETLYSQKKEISDRNERLEHKVKEKESQIYEQRDQQHRMAKQIGEKEVEMRGKIASLKEEIKHFEAELSHRDLKIKHLEEISHSKTIEIPAKQEQSNRDITEMKSKIIELTDQLNQSLDKLQDTKTELEETKTRLSKAMGNMLTDNNPNIADLSDKNRPTKLSERYAELYDNQWTDAFDILEKYFHVEENAIAALLHILKDTMTFCRNKAHEQMGNVRGVLALSNDKECGGISADLGKLLKDCRKAMASSALGNLCKMYMSHISQSSDGTTRAALQVDSFTKECLEVCWFMAIQDPPVVFAPELRKGSKFNTDLFKPYTSSGTHVDYIVWPALLLHEGGPVLAKGVAQGDGKKAT